MVTWIQQVLVLGVFSLSAIAVECALALEKPVAGNAQKGDGKKGEGAALPEEPKRKVVGAYPKVEEVEAAMRKAAMFCRSSLSFAGGYATSWSRDLAESGTSDSKVATVISIEAPGTPSFGSLYLRAWLATGDPLYFQALKEVKQVLLWTQLSSGGWETYHDFSLAWARKQHFRRDVEAGDREKRTRRALSTLDDDKTQLALLFLLELAQLPEFKDDEELQGDLNFGLEAVLAAQAPNGGWPQGFSGPADLSAPVHAARMPTEWPKVHPQVDYVGHYTLNDGNLDSVCRLLLRAHEVLGEAKYLEAVKGLGDFLLLAQCPAPQPGWAQQYNREMEPVWARKFEPPCVSSLETLGALETLHRIWLATGEEKYLKPMPTALAWLEKSRLPDGQYARFYELGSNRALYFVKDTYEMTYGDDNLPTHYGFKLDELQEDIDNFKKLLGRSREEILAKQKPKTTEKEWLSAVKGQAKKVVAAMERQNKDGLWTDENRYEAREIIENLMAMAKYVEAAKGAGGLFEEFRVKMNAEVGKGASEGKKE